MTGIETVAVRHAEEREYVLVGEITRRAFAAGPYGHLPKSPERLALENDARGRAAAGALLVAVAPIGRIAGSATLVRAGSSLALVARPGEAELRLLVVEPDSQGLGVGEALVDASVAEARRWGVSTLVLDTGALNFRAQRLYERCGFVRAVGRQTAAHSGRGEPPVVYAYPLD